ncbi:MAG TPA: hypothetical protein VKN99_04700 [Polyangia bacterium]|nr:hypothetical protein [Polyangia bacterium]
MKQRLHECARSAEELVPLLLALVEALGEAAGHGGKLEAQVQRTLELAVALRSDLRRLAKYADALEE